MRLGGSWPWELLGKWTLRMMDTLGTFFSGVVCEVQVRNKSRKVHVPSVSRAVRHNLSRLARQEDTRKETGRGSDDVSRSANGWEGFGRGCRMRLGKHPVRDLFFYLRGYTYRSVYPRMA